jgi:ornithine cyclodeaminase
VVVTATPASTPVLTEQALRPGALVVAMGADAAGKRELGPRILEQASLIVADSLDQCRAVGELQWLDKPDEKRVVELGAILCGAQAGRQTADDIIIFDSTGMGFQDVVGASQVLIAQQKR